MKYTKQTERKAPKSKKGTQQNYVCNNDDCTAIVPTLYLKRSLVFRGNNIGDMWVCQECRYKKF